jgi:hypothetical protein
MIELFDFSEALRKLKAGKKVAREGWNGKGLHVFLREGHLSVSYDETLYITDTLYITGMAPELGSGATITSWVPSQADLHANDWLEVTL